MQARTEHGQGKQSLVDIAPIQHQQGLIQSLPPNCSSEASASSYSQSGSSVVISPVTNHDVCDTHGDESSAQSGSSPLTEHDYIGLADSSSTAAMSQAGQKTHVHQVDLDLEEPDLRLGLGLSMVSKGAAEGGSPYTFFDVKRENANASHCKASCSSKSDVAHMHPHSSGTCPTSFMKRMDIVPMQSMRAVVIDPYAMKSVKRPFSETMVQVSPDVDTKSLCKHPQMVYWAASQVPSWHSGLAHNNSSYNQLACKKAGDSPPVSKNTLERGSPSSSMAMTNLETAPDEASPSKELVVGWPPVRSYRRSAIASRLRPEDKEGDVQTAIYVKVNMDGIPIGRKVDLNAYSSYEELLSALEGMFHSPHIGDNTRFLHARDFVLTYEDKEGDWMLVGDVPWRMFVNTVRRLRIMHGSDSTCLGSSTSKNLS